MKTVLVVDTNSILDFNKFYVFDRFNENDVYSKLTGFLLSKIKSSEITIIDKVYGEIYTNRYTEKLKKAIKPFVVDTFFLFNEVQDLIENNKRDEVIRINGLSGPEVEQILRRYEETYADLYLIAYCNYLEEQNIKPVLITEETFTDDKKLIEKIPTICKKEGIEFQKVYHALFEIYKDELRFTLDVHLKQ